MTAPLLPSAPIEPRPLTRFLPVFRARGRVDMTFGGRVLPGGATLEITELCGARPRSAAGLVVRSGAGAAVCRSREHEPRSCRAPFGEQPPAVTPRRRQARSPCGSASVPHVCG